MNKTSGRKTGCGQVGVGGSGVVLDDVGARTGTVA